MKAAFENWLKRLLCLHEWTLWNSRVKHFSMFGFHYEYVDHWIERDRKCTLCGKRASERYFVPAISTGGGRDLDWPLGVSRACREGRDTFDWDQRRTKLAAEENAPCK